MIGQQQIKWGQSKMPKQQTQGIYAGSETPDVSRQQTVRDLEDLVRLMNTGVKNSGFSCKKIIKLMSYLIKFDEDKLRDISLPPIYEDMFLSYNKSIDKIAELKVKYFTNWTFDFMTPCMNELDEVLKALLDGYSSILKGSSQHKDKIDTDKLKRYMEIVKIDNDRLHDKRIISSSFFKKYYDPFAKQQSQQKQIKQQQQSSPQKRIAPPKPPRPDKSLSSIIQQKTKRPILPFLSGITATVAQQTKQQTKPQTKRPSSFLDQLTAGKKILRNVNIQKHPKKQSKGDLLSDILNARLKKTDTTPLPPLQQKPNVLSDIKNGVVLRKTSLQQRDKPKQRQFTELQKAMMRIRKSTGNRQQQQQQQTGQDDPQWL